MRKRAEIQVELAEIEQRLAASRDMLQRTLIGARSDGTVVDLRFRTSGGVVRPGEPVLEIVPDNEELLIDARLSPMDIDVVRAGLPAQVVLPAFQQRHMPRIDGTRASGLGRTPSSTRRPAQRYFQARIEIDRDAARGAGARIELTPGMPAEVYIMTGERTALDYLLSPLRQPAPGLARDLSRTRTPPKGVIPTGVPDAPASDVSRLLPCAAQFAMSSLRFSV